MQQLKTITNQITAAICRHWLTALFVALYVLVTGATLRHSAAGFASLEGGSVAWGYLSALAVDAGMALSATGLRRRFDWGLAVGLIVSAAASTFTQWLYAVTHAALLPVAPGAEWMGEAAELIINARVWILPALLPALSIVYSIASKSVGSGDDAETAGVEALRETITEYETRDAGRLREIARLTRGVAAWDLLNKTQRAELIARCTTGDRPGVSEVATAIDASPSTVRRAWGKGE